jgi:hypothetical protein
MRPVPLKATVAQFDGAKTDCPIWFDDECEAIKAKLVSSDSFRELLQLREHFFERKNQEKRRLRGCARIVLACNEPSDIRFSDIAGPAAVQAIVDRLALFVVPREQTDTVRAALAKLRPTGAQDVDVERIVGHLAWVQATVTPRVQRFLGARSNVVEAKRAAYAGVVASAPVIFEELRDYLADQPQKRAAPPVPPALMRDGGQLFALPSALVRHCSKTDARVDLAAVQRALEPFRAGQRQAKRIGGGDGAGGSVHRYWPLDEDALRCALE